MGIEAAAMAQIISSLAVAASTAISAKKQGKRAKKTEKTAKEAQEKARLEKGRKLKSPGQRLLGGKPTLG